MRRRRRLWIILLATPLVLLAADTLYWWIAVRYLARGFATWEAEQSAAGWIDQHGPPRRGGWPFAATLTVPAIAVSGDGADISLRPAWHADRLVLRVGLARPGALEIAAEGRQQLRLAGVAVPFSAERLLLTVPVQTEPRPGFVDLIADDLHADTPVGGDAGVQSLRVRLDFGPKAQSDDPALGFSLKAEGVSLPAGIVRPLGPRIASFEVDGAATGPVPAGRTPAEQAAAWRDGGGSLEIQHLAMVWGPLDLTATATLALDDQLQPMGAGSAHLVGYAETLDALAAHAAISRSAAIATKAVLSLMAHNPEDGSPPDVEVPLTLQYRTLSMRQVPLVRLPELDWP
jgi:Uncharacterized protein conserved in bacteria (DUF2125)